MCNLKKCTSYTLRTQFRYTYFWQLHDNIIHWSFSPASLVIIMQGEVNVIQFEL